MELLKILLQVNKSIAIDSGDLILIRFQVRPHHPLKQLLAAGLFYRRPGFETFPGVISGHAFIIFVAGITSY